MNDIDAIRGFIWTELLATATSGPGPASLGNAEALLTSGLIDSLAVIRLVDFLERQFSIRISPQAVTLENFETLAAIDAYVARLKG